MPKTRAHLESTRVHVRKTLAQYVGVGVCWLPFGELGLVVDSSCLSPWVGEPGTPAGGYHTSVDVWLTGTYHA